jgi:hypothetical protein
MGKQRHAPEQDDAAPPPALSEQQRHEQLLEALGRLKSVVEEQLASIHDRLEHVAEVVREAVEEIGVLRDAIDDEREVIAWAAHNNKPIFHLTSFPTDPIAEDWAARVNTLTPQDLAAQPATSKSEPKPLASPTDKQMNLWS